MSIRNAFIAFSIISTTLASPLLDTRQDNPCHPVNMVNDQRVWNCNHKYTTDGNGHCMSGIPDDPSPECTGYCEMSISKGYAQEVPIYKGYCQEKTTCSYQNSETVSTSQTWTVQATLGMGSGDDISKALTGTFNAGASYSWSQTLSYTTGVGSQKTLGAGQCGYWTFIPFQMTSCGTFTSVGQRSESGGILMGAGIVVCDQTTNVVDTQNWCNNSLYYDENGHADGEVHFIYIDCSHGGLLQNDQIPQIPNDPSGPATQPAAIFYPADLLASLPPITRSRNRGYFQPTYAA
ncbi:hypothetical protein G7Y89_g15145 [Cudoniella acicularis]|uniref:Uncharacterized protein n=1 Tax=Cudoniella acicularis TaxID=354080 RepID=A0A8H4QS78_9HELO|nr:hypothetical protein G7Y89_g15145 [Cudoniella acicularis]